MGPRPPHPGDGRREGPALPRGAGPHSPSGATAFALSPRAQKRVPLTPKRGAEAAEKDLALERPRMGATGHSSDP